MGMVPAGAGRWRRGVLLGLAGATGFLICGLGILLLPPVQRSILRSFVDRPGLSRLEMKTVRIRPGSFLIEGLVVEKAGMQMEAGRLRGEGAFWAALIGRPLRIRDYRVEDWRLRLEAAGPGSDGPPGIPAESMAAFLPLAVAVDRVRMEGRVEVWTGSDRAITLELVAEGQGLGPGRTGQLAITGTLTGQGSDGPVYPLVMDSTVSRGEGTDPIEAELQGGLGATREVADLALRIRSEAAVLQLEGTLRADLAMLGALLPSGDGPRIASGGATLRFASGSNPIGETMIEGELAVTDLVAGSGGYRVDRVDAPFRLFVVPGASLSLRVPLEVERAGTVSDLLVAVAAVADGPDWQIEGGLSGGRILVDDLAVLAPVFRVPADPATVDATPAWRNLRGRLDLDFGRVEVNRDLVLEDLVAGLDFAAKEVRIDEATAGLAGGAVSGRLTLGFEVDAPDPYRLQSRWAASKVEISQLIGGKGTLPVVDGPFALELTTDAPGPNLRVLGDRMVGQLAVLGGPGRFRGFREQARAASSLAGMLGVFLGSDRLQTLAGLADELGQIDYDQIRLNLQRDEVGGLTIKRLQLQGPGIKLAGEGWVGRAGLMDYGGSPMELTFRMGAKGDLADLFGKLGLTEMGRIDAEGYRLLVQPVTIRGTPARPDASEFWAILRQAASESLLGGR